MEFVRYGQDLRYMVAGVDTMVPLENGLWTRYINLDNAATTPPFIAVLQDIVNFAPWYSSVHRGTGYKSKFTSEFYENSRDLILDFVGADKKNQILIYVKNTTEAINKLSNRLKSKGSRNIILCTDMEHHSNDLPWRRNFDVIYVNVDEQGKLSFEDMKYKLKKYKDRVLLVTITGASNVTGYVNDIYYAAELAHKYGTQILVDGAQLVSHVPVQLGNMDSPKHIDYIVFSSHKMYAPFGIGILIGPRDTFEEGSPDYVGGGTVDKVSHDMVKWLEPPEKEEAGSPNVMGVVALCAAIKTLNSIGMERIKRYEEQLTEYTLKKLNNIPDINIYGNKENSDKRIGIISFNIDGINHEIVAEALSREGGIGVRNGCFCAQYYMRKLLNVSYPSDDAGMVRISFGLYNNFSEIDALIQKLDYIQKNKKYVIERYR